MKNYGLFPYINAPTNTKIEVDGVVYTLDASTILRDDAGTIIGDGVANILPALISVNDQVKDIVAVDGVIKTFVRVRTEAEKVTVANAAVGTLETETAKDLTVKANLEAAEAAVAPAELAVGALAAGTTKTTLQGKVTVAKGTIATARTTFDAAALVTDANTKVGTLETEAAKDLTVKANLEAAEAAVSPAEVAVAKLPAGAAKTTLEGKITTAKGTIETARTAFDAAVIAAEVNKYTVAADATAMKALLDAAADGTANPLNLNMNRYNGMSDPQKTLLVNNMLAVKGSLTTTALVQDAINTL